MQYSNGLSESFLKEYEDKTPPWGPMGYVIYKRTYSRMIPELGRAEEWNETCARVCSGLVEIGGKFKQEELDFLYDTMFYLRGSVSGRALWQLGTDTVRKLGADSLQNCWLVTVNDLSAFTFTFNQLMLGGGVGFNILPQYVYEMPEIMFNPPIGRVDTHDCDFIVPDNREGWVQLLERILEAFYYTGKPFYYNTTCVRTKGAPIRGFGGVASGPEDLVMGMKHIVRILRARFQKKLRPIDAMDIMNIIGEVVVSGNVRRSSEIAVGDPHDIPYLDAKNWGKHQIPNWRTMSNNSVAADRYSDIMPQFWDSGYTPNLNGETEGEPYGFVNLRNCRRYGRLIDGSDPGNDPNVVGVNPCVTADTRVMVADGRGSICIDQMKCDTPVYCVDSNDSLTIKMARNPRITGHNVPIVKVEFDNGESMRVTPNHGFLTRRGKVRADELLVGESVRVLTRYTPENCEGDSRADKYISLGWAGQSVAFEHVEISRFFSGNDHLEGRHVHHVDGHRLNNAPGNLRIKPAFDHLSAHSVGHTNARFSGFTHSQMIEHGVSLCKTLGRRMAVNEWQQYAKDNNLPQSFSLYRSQELGSLRSFADACALEAGVDSTGDPRTLRTLLEMYESGFDAYVDDSPHRDGKTVFVVKECEVCKQVFNIHYASREQCVCGHTCALKHPSYERETRNESIRNTYAKKAEGTRQQQLKVYSDLQFKLKRPPMKKEWVVACKTADVSHEISRKTSPFRTYSLLKEAASTFNHKVVSVTPCGNADVWNVTVDDCHNLFYGGWDEGLTPAGRRKMVGILNTQCAEITLANKEGCNLAEIFLPNIRNIEEFEDVAAILFKACKTISNGGFSDPETHAIVKQHHRIGVGLTGYMQAPQYRNPDILDRVYRHLIEVDRHYSRVLGIKMSIKRTTMKPSGTLSLLPGVTPGMHGALGRWLFRTVRISANHPLVEVCRDHGYHMEPKLELDGTHNHDTMVIYFPIETPPEAELAEDMDVIDELEVQKTLQTYWADNSVSATHYFEAGDVPRIQKWLKDNYDDSVKATSFLLRTEHGFKQAPYQPISEERYREEIAKVRPITHVVIEEGWDDYDDTLECASGHCPVK